MRFWLDKGVSGFRMDVIPYISKPDEMPASPPKPSSFPNMRMQMARMSMTTCRK